jgi:hypothetical protein
LKPESKEEDQEHLWEECACDVPLWEGTKSWIDKALKNKESTHDSTFESAFGVSNHLCRFYRDSFVAAIEKQGIAISQPLSTVQYVGMMSALNIAGMKERELTKYL